MPSLAEDWTVSADGLSLTVKLAAEREVSRRLAADGGRRRRRASRDGCRTLMGPAFEDVEGVTRSRRSAGRRSDFRRPSPFLLESLEAPIQKPGSPLRRHRALRGGRSEVPDRNACRTTHYYLGTPGSRPHRRSILSRACARRGPSCCATSSTCSTKSALDALDSLETVEQRRRLHVHAPLSVPHRPEPRRPTSSSRQEIRRALNLAIDRDAVVRDALNGHGVASSGPVWPQHWALPPDLPKFEFDADRPRPSSLAAAQGQRRIGPFHLSRAARHGERAARAGGQAPAGGGRRRHGRRRSRRWTASYDALKTRRFDAALIDVHQRPDACCGRISSGIRRRRSTAGGLGNATVDAALDRVRQRRLTTSTRRRSPGFSRRSSTTRRRSFSPGRSAPARSANDSTCRRRARPRHLGDASPLATGSGRLAQTSRELMALQIRHIATRFALLLAARRVLPLRRLRRRLDLLAAARHPRHRSSPATRTSPPAPPRKSAATSSPTPRS